MASASPWSFRPSRGRQDRPNHPSVPGYVTRGGDRRRQRRGTDSEARRSGRRGLEVIRHPENRAWAQPSPPGTAGADARAGRHRGDGGDSRMDPADLLGLLLSAVSKGGRLRQGNRSCGRALAGDAAVAAAGEPGPVVLTRLPRGTAAVRLACGYTAANRVALATIVGGPLFPATATPNHLLVRLGRAGMKVTRRAGAAGVRRDGARGSACHRWSGRDAAAGAGHRPPAWSMVWAVASRRAGGRGPAVVPTVGTAAGGAGGSPPLDPVFVTTPTRDAGDRRADRRAAGVGRRAKGGSALVLWRRVSRGAGWCT